MQAVFTWVTVSAFIFVSHVVIFAAMKNCFTNVNRNLNVDCSVSVCVCVSCQVSFGKWVALPNLTNILFMGY